MNLKSFCWSLMLIVEANKQPINRKQQINKKQNNNENKAQCADTFLECNKYKNSCHVEKFQNMCPKTCGMCPEDLLSARSSMGCEDEYEVCRFITFKQCKENESIKKHCRKTCKSCNSVQLIYKGSASCAEKSWCKSLFNGNCLAIGRKEDRIRYGSHCPIECRKPECEFEWAGGLVEEKKDIDGCKDISNVCQDLMDTLPNICTDQEKVMTQYCQKSCRKCDVIVADDDVNKLECKDYNSNCAMKNLFDQKLGRANSECIYDPTESNAVQVRKLRYQGFCRKTCNLCDDVIFQKEVKNEIKLDPACGPTVTPDCNFLEKTGICLADPHRCIYGCTLCRKPKDLLPLILPQQEIEEFRNSLKKSRNPIPKPAPKKQKGATVECKNLAKNCPKWRCKNLKFRAIMAKHCKKTCGYC